jgi:SAM-dependent methyltransferase
VLDVGCGGGRAAFAVAPPAGTVVGVDHQQGMLDAFAVTADARGLVHREVLGDWPDVAEATPVADVVVCHHVVYNVADLAPFVTALDARLEEWEEDPSVRAVPGLPMARQVEFMRIRLCLTPDRDAELARVMAALPPAPRRLATIWWDGTSA